MMLVRGFADVIKVSNQLTLRLSMWAWSNHVSPLEAESFLSLVAVRGETHNGETHNGWPRRKQISMWIAHGKISGAKRRLQHVVNKRVPDMKNYMEWNSADNLRKGLQASDKNCSLWWHFVVILGRHLAENPGTLYWDTKL